MLAPGGTYSCQFQGAVSGNAGDTETDTVTVEATDTDAHTATDTDSAQVTLDDVTSTISVVKTAGDAADSDAFHIDEPGDTVTFHVTVTNTSTVDDLTITSLTDDVYLDLDGQGTCDISTTPIVLAPGGTYSCQFQGAVSGNAGDTETDTVTVEATDTDAHTATDTDSAQVTLDDVTSTISVVKTAGDAADGDAFHIDEPGDTVTFHVTVTNTSTVDDLTITSLTDDVYLDLDGQGTCDISTTPIVLAPGGTYSCQFQGAVSGNGDTETDTVTVEATDTDAHTATDTDSAQVTLDDVTSTISVVKTAGDAADGDAFHIDEPGDTVTFHVTVTNTSTVDDLTITSLTDDVYLDLDGQGTCDISTTPIVLAPGGTYSCQFQGAVSGNAEDTETDTVTVEATDTDAHTATDTDSAQVTLDDVIHDLGREDRRRRRRRRRLPHRRAR